MNSPKQKLAVIRLSFQCFVFGIFGLIPFVGWFFRVPEMILAHEALKVRGDEWNPAARYLTAGRIMALVGIGLDAWILIAIMVTKHGYLFDQG